MSNRLATEYTNSRLDLTYQEIEQLCKLFQLNQIEVEFTPCELGWYELRAHKDAERLHFLFQQVGERYILEGDFRMNDRDFIDVMRQALMSFKGHAIVNRIYQQFTLSYHYEHGAVVRIVEQNDEREKMIFERRHQRGEAIPFATASSTSDRLEAVFQRKSVESTIHTLRSQIDECLDIRNRIVQRAIDVPEQIQAIDNQLAGLHKQLLACEAY